MDLIQFITNPSAVAEKIKEQPQWVKAFIILGIISIIIGWLTLPYAGALGARQLESLSPEAAENAMKYVRIFSYVGVLMAPIGLLIKWAIAAVVIMVVGMAFKVSASFMQLFCMVVYANVITTISGLFNLINLMIKGTESVTSAMDLNVISLHALFDPENVNRVLYAIMASINPFEIWYVIALGMGLSVIYNVPRSKGIWISVVYWVIVVIISGFMASLGARFQH
ncbi:MAG: YIP1 family protein [Candidatus Delongbacteria bacterium]|nr:YIP1 family protein [Candidatus Delongbacteria bacterium]